MMMMPTAFLIGFALGLFAALGVGLIAYDAGIVRMCKEAIKRGYARYNETTGEWEWK